MEQTPEFAIRRVMGKGYIDTPGLYHKKADIVRFMRSNMSHSRYERLKEWYIKNPEKVKKFMM